MCGSIMLQLKPGVLGGWMVYAMVPSEPLRGLKLVFGFTKRSLRPLVEVLDSVLNSHIIGIRFMEKKYVLMSTNRHVREESSLQKW